MSSSGKNGQTKPPPTGGIVSGFVRGVAANRVSLIGAVVSLGLFPILTIYPILDNLGVVDEPRLHFIIYGALTWIFIAALLMVFLGLYVLRNKRAAPLFFADEFIEHLLDPQRFGGIRRVILFVTFLTVVNIGVIAVSAYNGFRYSESADFCARLCHEVMTPEYTSYQNSPHSRVECVECHIGSGATWFMRSKLSGIKQLAAVVWDTYSKPIGTPIHGLRPARETCQECHRPELFHGERLKVIDRFLEDEGNTHVQTVMLMKVGSGDYRGLQAQGSHWHVASKKNITYEHTDRERLDVTVVRIAGDDGVERVYTRKGLDGGGEGEGGSTREMDCLDCHNRPTHIYLGPSEALDYKLLTGEIPGKLPYIKKQGLRVVTAEYASREEAVGSISRGLRTWYADNYPEIAEKKSSLIAKAVEGVTRAYTENVFPEMNIGYGTYRINLGHRDGGGCFRCHDDSHRTAGGRAIPQDCDLCHIIIAEEEPVRDLAATLEESK
ncbi:MAG: NapC/NirT family cytochrome c, partial [bacterium]